MKTERVESVSVFRKTETDPTRKYDSVNELTMTRVGFPWSGGCRDVGKRSGHAFRSEIGRCDLGGREGVGGRLRGSEDASARRRGRRARRSGSGRGLGCGKVRERSGRALGGGAGGRDRAEVGVEVRGRVEIWVRSGSSLLVFGTFDEN